MILYVESHGPGGSRLPIYVPRIVAHVPLAPPVVRETVVVSMLRTTSSLRVPLARQLLLLAPRLDLNKIPFRVWVPVGSRPVLENTGCGGCCTISSPIVPQLPQRSPLSLLPSPIRVRVTRVSSAHREEVGELPTVSPTVASSLRARDPGHAVGRRLFLF